jgi:hypothetical protein
MANAGLLKDSSGIFPPSPVMDESLLTVSDDLKELERRIDSFDVEAANWRASAISKLSQLRVDSGVALSERNAAQAELAAALGVIEKGLKVFDTPMHASPDVARSVDRLTSVSGSSVKFARKLLRRIERIRVAQYAAHVDLYYGLLALQSEFEDPEASETFRDPEKLGAFLRKQLV